VIAQSVNYRGGSTPYDTPQKWSGTRQSADLYLAAKGRRHRARGGRERGGRAAMVVGRLWRCGEAEGYRLCIPTGSFRGGKRARSAQSSRCIGCGSVASATRRDTGGGAQNLLVRLAVPGVPRAWWWNGRWYSSRPCHARRVLPGKPHDDVNVNALAAEAVPQSAFL
jgi:hypothetical protein